VDSFRIVIICAFAMLLKRNKKHTKKDIKIKNLMRADLSRFTAKIIPFERVRGLVLSEDKV
jgi:hypothetical protein